MRRSDRAFAEHGLDWTWDRDDYRAMLATSGGRSRIAEYAEARGQTVDAQAVHATKSAFFRESLAGAATPRPGVVDASRAGPRHRDEGRPGDDDRSGERRSAARRARRGHRPRRLRRGRRLLQVDQPKPDAAAYEFALRQLGEDPADAIAVEDNVGGVRSAVAADVTCVAFPNANTAGHDFPGAAQGGRPPRPGRVGSPMTAPSPTFTAAETAFHVETYEKVDYSLLYVDGAFRVGNPEIADSYRPFGRCLMVVDETVLRPLRRADARLLRPSRPRADGVPRDDPGARQDARHRGADRRRLRRVRAAPDGTRAGRRGRPDHGRRGASPARCSAGPPTTSACPPR